MEIETKAKIEHEAYADYLKEAVKRLTMMGVPDVKDDKKAETLAALNIVDDEKSVDVDQLRVVLYGAAEAGGGVIAFKKGFFTVRVPRPMIDKFFKYIETGTVQ